MHDENLHIVPDPEKGFPRPDVPADEAWNKMAGLLDAEMPASPPSKPPTDPPHGGFLGGSWNFWGITIGTIAMLGVVTWAIISLTSNPQKHAVITGTDKSKQEITISDSSDLKDKAKAIQSEKPGSPETIQKQGNNANMPVTRPISKESVQPGVDAVVVAPPSDVAEKPKTNEPVQVGVGNVTTVVKDIAVHQPANETTLKDTALFAKSLPLPAPVDTTSAKQAEKMVTDVNPPTQPASKTNPDESKNLTGAGKTKKSSGMSENLTWKMDVNGNIGQVFQKGRNANTFYGALVTGGLWNERLKGGVETGLGWEVYKDYGSITQHVYITDSIPIDTLGNYYYVDYFNTTEYKYHYQYLQIPLFISKQLFAAGKFSLDLKTGPLVGIMISERKTVANALDPDEGDITTTVDNDYTRLKISWQWQIMAQFRWNFNDRLSLTLYPYGIFYLNNLYDKKNRPATMPYGIGLNVGLIYRFR